MSKSDDEEQLPGVVSPRRPAWHAKFLALVDKAEAEVKAMREAEEKASQSKDNPVKT